MTRFAAYALASCAAAGAALALAATPAAAQLAPGGGPIDITADETEFLDTQRMSRWIGKVEVVQGDVRLMADRMDVYFAENSGGGVGEIERIEAVGAVRYVKPGEVARAERGVYFASTEQIEMCGDVTIVVQNESTLAGDCLIVEPELGRSRMVAPAGSRGDRGATRVRGVFFPSSTADE